MDTMEQQHGVSSNASANECCSEWCCCIVPGTNGVNNYFSGGMEGPEPFCVKREIAYLSILFSLPVSIIGGRRIHALGLKDT